MKYQLSCIEKIDIRIPHPHPSKKNGKKNKQKGLFLAQREKEKGNLNKDMFLSNSEKNRKEQLQLTTVGKEKLREIINAQHINQYILSICFPLYSAYIASSWTCNSRGLIKIVLMISFYTILFTRTEGLYFEPQNITFPIKNSNQLEQS